MSSVPDLSRNAGLVVRTDDDEASRLPRPGSGRFGELALGSREVCRLDVAGGVPAT